MSATPAEVESAQNALGCDRWKCQCGETDGCDGIWRCVNHNTAWAERGCSEAVSAADAVVAAAERRFAADALRDAADVWATGISVYETWTRGTIARSLRARADRIEAQS